MGNTHSIRIGEAAFLEWREMSVIEALLAAEHDLAFLHGSTASDGYGSWTIDHAETLAKIRAALEAIGVSNETGRECASCRNRPLRPNA